MINKWRIVLLGIVFSQNSSIIAMQKGNKSPESPRIVENLQKINLLSSSAELRNKVAAITVLVNTKLSCSAEMRQEGGVKRSSYHGCGGNTPQEDTSSRPYSFIRDVCPFDFSRA